MNGRWVLGGSGIALCFLLAGPAAADRAVPSNPRYVFQEIGERLGLGTRAVVSLAQDGAGFIWIGCRDGLYRFDGLSAAEYGPEEGLPSKVIVQLVLGPDDVLWVSTDGGIARFDGLRFVPVVMSENDTFRTRRHVQQHIAVDRDNNLWVASQSGLVRLPAGNRRRPEVFSVEAGLPATGVDAVHAAPDGSIWVGGAGQVGVFDLATGRAQLLPLPGPARQEVIRTILVNADGAVWVRTPNLLSYRKVGATQLALEDVSLPVAATFGIPSLDRSGNLLLPTLDGLYLAGDEGWELVSEEQGLLTNMVHVALQDHEGALWLGLGGAGVTRWAGRKQWSAWTTAEGLPDNTVWGMDRDARGRLWVGVNRAIGIWDPSAGRWLTMGEEQGLEPSMVGQTYRGPDDAMWSVTSTGVLMRTDPDRLIAERVSLPEGRETDNLRMGVGPNRTLWLGSYDFLLRVVARAGRAVVEEVPLPPRVVGRTLFVSVSPGGVVWTSGREGLARLEGASWTVFSEEDGLRANHVRYVAAKSNDEVWVTHGDLVGLTRMRLVEGKPQFRHFTSEDGLPSDTVYLVGVDALGRVWAGGNAGVAAIAENGTLRVFNRGNGLIWDDLSAGGFLAEPDGSFFLGTSRGLAHYQPAADDISEPPPRVAITSAQLGASERLHDQKAEADWDDRSFSVRFAGATFRNPNQVLFQYRLKGLKEGFRETHLRELRYPALPAGRYVFEVSCRSAAGVWSPEPATFAFRVRGPWWYTWWARTGMALALVAFILVVVRLRTRKLEADRERLEHAVEKRNAELAEANRELEELSFTDVLTGAHNRRYFMTVIPDEIARVQRRYDRRSAEQGNHDNNLGLMFLLVDIDWFKQVNDEHGHLAGDSVLTQVSGRLRDAARETDLLVRWGGEEFMLVCRDADPHEARAVAKRVLESIGGEPFDLRNGLGVRRTCSVGWAGFPWADQDPNHLTYEQIIELADKALYDAKASGRNQAVGVTPHAGADFGDHVRQWLDRPLTELDGSMLEVERQHGPERPT